MTAVNKTVSKGKVSYLSGSALSDQSFPVVCDPMSLSGASSLKVSVLLKLKSTVTPLSGISASIVDLNRTIDAGTAKESHHALSLRGLAPDNLDNGSEVNQVDVNLLSGEPKLQLNISGDIPNLDGDVTVAYQVVALETI